MPTITNKQPPSFMKYIMSIMLSGLKDRCKARWQVFAFAVVSEIGPGFSPDTIRLQKTWALAPGTRKLIKTHGTRCMHIRIFVQTSTRRIGRDVTKLVGIVLIVGDTMRVIAGLPDFAQILLSHGKGETAFDELSSFLDRFCGCQKNVDMVRHDHVTVQKKAPCIAVTKNRGEHEICIGGVSKDVFAFMRYGRERVVPGAKARLF